MTSAATPKLDPTTLPHDAARLDEYVRELVGVRATVDIYPERSGAESSGRYTGWLVEIAGVPLRQPPTGADLIAAERRRQIDVEGRTPEHDQAHGYDLLRRAAAAYEWGQRHGFPDAWEWKPKNRLRDLIRAGALYQAAADATLMAGEADTASGYRDRVAAKIDVLLDEARRIDRGEK